MPRVLIIGYGNPFRGDDGLAWRAIEMLAHNGLSPEVELLIRHQLTPELALLASQAETVLFLDAGADTQAVRIWCEPVTPVKQAAIFSHELAPSAVLALAAKLYGTVPRAFVISLRGKCFQHGETLSPEVLEALPDFVGIVTDVVEKAMAPYSVYQESFHG